MKLISKLLLVLSEFVLYIVSWILKFIMLFKQLNRLFIIKFCVLLVAVICKQIFFIPFFLYSAACAFACGNLIRFLDDVSVELDVLLNVSGQYPLTHTLVLKGGIPHGNRLFTISGEMGRNLRLFKLSPFGKQINKYILNPVDKNHLENAIANNNKKIISEYKKLKYGST